MVLVNININYKIAIFPNETVKIETTIQKIGEKSVTISQNIYKKEILGFI